MARRDQDGKYESTGSLYLNRQNERVAPLQASARALDVAMEPFNLKVMHVLFGRHDPSGRNTKPVPNEDDLRIRRMLAERYGSKEAGGDVLGRVFMARSPLDMKLRKLARGTETSGSPDLLAELEGFYEWHKSHQPIMNPGEEGLKELRGLRASIDEAKEAGLFTARIKGGRE